LARRIEHQHCRSGGRRRKNRIFLELGATDKRETAGEATKQAEKGGCNAGEREGGGDEREGEGGGGGLRDASD
jgi:hypothetical protein